MHRHVFLHAGYVHDMHIDIVRDMHILVVGDCSHLPNSLWNSVCVVCKDFGMATLHILLAISSPHSSGNPKFEKGL